MGKKKGTKPKKTQSPRKPRRREQRRTFKKRFKAFFDGSPDSDLDYCDDSLEWIIEPPEDYSPE